MINDVTMLWKGVVDRMFRNGTAKCVEGSTGDKSSVSGGGQTKAGSVPPPSRTSPEQRQGIGNKLQVSVLCQTIVILALSLLAYH